MGEKTAPTPRVTASYRKHRADLLRSVEEAVDQHSAEYAREAGLPYVGKAALKAGFARLIGDLAGDYDGAPAAGDRGYTLLQAANVALSRLKLCSRDHAGAAPAGGRRRPGGPHRDLEGEIHEVERAVERAYRTRAGR